MPSSFIGHTYDTLKTLAQETIPRLERAVYTLLAATLSFRYDLPPGEWEVDVQDYGIKAICFIFGGAALFYLEPAHRSNPLSSWQLVDVTDVCMPEYPVLACGLSRSEAAQNYVDTVDAGMVVRMVHEGVTLH